MIVKIVTIFLAVMAVLALFGRVRIPGSRQLQSARCPKCGRLRIGKGPCACGNTSKKG